MAAQSIPARQSIASAQKGFPAKNSAGLNAQLENEAKLKPPN